MKNILKSAFIAVAVLVGPSPVYADSGVEGLSPELRTLLKKEMQALQEGMQAILPAYVSGDLTTVIQIAKQIKHSYILKQGITHEQKHELQTRLPKSFLHRDKKFHEYAGMLAHVAEEKHMDLVGFYYAKLTEACVSCHTEYASHQFPGLQAKSGHHDHHH